MRITEFNKPAGTGINVSPYYKLSGFIAEPDETVPVPATGFPVLIYFHGNGGVSRTSVLNQLYSEDALPKQIKAKMWNRPFVVVALQDEYSSPNPHNVAYVLENYIFTKNNIDKARVYTTGLSYGGNECLAMALHYPHYVSAVVSASPSSLSTDANSYVTGTTEEQALYTIAVNKIAVAYWVGMLDNSGGYVDRVNKYYDVLFNAGDTTYKESKLFKFNKPNIGHSGWGSLYNGTDKIAGGKDMYDFLLQFSKTVLPPVEEPEEPKEPEKKLLCTIKVYDDGSSETVKA